MTAVVVARAPGVVTIDVEVSVLVRTLPVWVNVVVLL